MFAHQPRRTSSQKGQAARPTVPDARGLLSRKTVPVIVALVVIGALLVAWRPFGADGIMLSSRFSGQSAQHLAGDTPEGVAGSGGEVQSAGVLADQGAAQSTTQSTMQVSTQAADRTATDIYVHISGAVNSPGVICLPEGSRLIDAVESCGGLTDSAASDFINLAAPLIDGTHVYIPDKSDIESLREQGINPERELIAGGDWNSLASAKTGMGSSATGSGSTTASSSPSQQSGFPVDINSADSVTLQTVPGIGPVTAQRIIDYRNQNGAFRNLDDLILVSGIGEKRLTEMRPYLICR